MPLPAFTASAPLTMGVELEVQLVGRTDLDLTPASPDLLHLLQRTAFPGTASPEITQSMFEMATGVHMHFDALRDQLVAMRDAVVRAGDRLNVGIAGGGTHPFQDWTQRRIFPKPRFHEVSTLYGYLTQQFTVFGQHVHIGCPDGDEALYVLHALGRYVPHFIALAASSPFVEGRDTRFNSARLNSVSAFPLSGRAPLLLTWEAFGTYFEKMERTGVVRSMKDFYWDIRPKPEYGTIELRVCDTPLTVERAAAIAAYLQAIVASLRERTGPVPCEDDYLVYGYNRFQACRFGLDGTVVRPDTLDSVAVRDDIRATLERVRPFSERLGSTEALALISRITQDGSDASWLRQVRADRGSVEAVVDAAVDRFHAGEMSAR